MTRRPIFVEENKKRLSPRLGREINRTNPLPSTLKKQRDWRAQSKQPRTLVRFEAPKTKPIIIELHRDGLSVKPAARRNAIYLRSF